MAQKKEPKKDATPAAQNDPAANDLPGENSRDGARKRRDPNEPRAVVGLGASAGGVTVLQQFFEQMPPESGIAFVVVMHLSPDFESQLASVLQQRTSMPVIQVSEPVRVRPNHIYVIPPNHQLTFEDDTLLLCEPQQAQGRRVTIDLFFRTLAQAYGQRAVCVVFSGSDSDGVIGLKHIRAQGGVTIAQDPEEAEFDTMPRGAIQTGMVDWILKVSEMPGRLMDLVKNESAMKLPPEIPEAMEPDAKVEDAPGGETISDETRAADDEEAIAEVLKHVRVQTGHDFTHYKRATILRRIARRMQVNSVESIPRYLDFLRTHNAEARALLHDLLIGVTHFFRDQESFAALEAHIPQLFAGRKAEDEIRIWVPGCATGEEAYSVAILLCEHADKLNKPPKIQIFATDIDEQAVHIARQGCYPVAIEADVSQERLRIFFGRDGNQYRVRKEVREMVLFAGHNLLTDAPFSRIDLVSCRNLLIYLTRTAQEKVFDIFHFALRSGGLLFIGGAETGDNARALFTPIDAKHRLYVRRSIPRPAWKMPVLPLRAPIPRQPIIETRPPLMNVMTRTAVQDASERTEESEFTGQERRAVLFGELHLKLLEEYGPPSVVVNESYDIVHLSEHAGCYLTFRAGEATTNLIKVIHSDLRVELRTALFRASQSNERITVPDVRIHLVTGDELITLQVRPVRPSDSAHGFFVVLFEKQTTPPGPEVSKEQRETVDRQLGDEVDRLKQQLDATVGQYEASSEELKASNEELQAMNEEMRSAAEELETSKEELQSVNEELITVNHELKEKVEELSRVNSDLQNLMAATDIGTIFLDRQLRVQRFTPPTREIFNLQPSDIGRPISDITHKMEYDRLIGDAHEVLERLTPVAHEVLERLTPVAHEVLGSNARHFLTRIAPYRTTEDKISGVVLTFLDITHRKRAEDKLRESEARLRRAIEIETIGIFFFTLEGTITEANEAFLKLTGYTREDLEDGRVRWDKMTPPEWMPLTREEMSKFSATGKIGPYEKQYIRKDGTRWWGLFTGTHLEENLGVEYVLNISNRKEAEEALRQSEERFRQFAENSADVFWILNAATTHLEYLNPVYEKMFGQSRDVVLRDRKRRLDVVHPEDREEAGAGLAIARAGKTFTRNYRIIRATDGEMRWIRDTGYPIRDEAGKVVRIAGVAQDVTDERERAEELRQSEEKLRLLAEGAQEYAMFLMDPGNHIIYWSKGAERIFGWSADEALGETGRIIFTPEDVANKVEEKELALARRKGSAPDRRWHMRKDGSRFWVDGVMHRLDDENGELRGYAKIARDATEQQRNEITLRQSHDEMEERVRERTRDLSATNAELERIMQQRQQLEKELLEISEREKRRIGQDLHDIVCQELSAAALVLKSSANRAEKKSPATAKTLNDAAEIVNRNVTLARNLARGFQPMKLSGGEFTAAMRGLVSQVNATNRSMHCTLDMPRPIEIADETLALNIYRIAQEALTNAIKHADAKNVIVSLKKGRGELELTVADDGDGFPRKKRSGKGLGLHIMDYRASVLGGKFSIDTGSSGTRIVCTIPLKASSGKK